MARQLTDEERALRSRLGRIGAHESWARTADRAARTVPGRAAAMARFEQQVDPDGVLSPGERAVRAEHARRAYFQRLALKRWGSKKNDTSRGANPGSVKTSTGVSTGAARAL